VVAAAAEVAAGAVASVVAAVAGSVAAGAAEVAVAGSVAAEVAAAAGSVASFSVAAWAAWVALAAWVARVAADPGERAACAKSHEKRRCDGRRITGLSELSDKLGVGRHFAKVHKSSLLMASTYRLRSITH
jgi:hypothetical protein